MNRQNATFYQWLTLLTIAVLYVLVPTVYNQFIVTELHSVRCRWREDTLRFSTISGLVEITHLMGQSNRTPVVARLPEPLFLVDSESVGIAYASMKSLTWHSEGGHSFPVPPPGSPIVVLYRRLDAGTFVSEKN